MRLGWGQEGATQLARGVAPSAAFGRVSPGLRPGETMKRISPAVVRASEDQALAGWRMGPGPAASQSQPSDRQAAGMKRPHHHWCFMPVL